MMSASLKIALALTLIVGKVPGQIPPQIPVSTTPPEPSVSPKPSASTSPSPSHIPTASPTSQASPSEKPPSDPALEDPAPAASPAPTSASPAISATPHASALPQDEPGQGSTAEPSRQPIPGSTTAPITGSGDKSPCQSDIVEPTPVLGNSQVLYALAIVGSTASIAIASLAYSLAAEWEVSHTHELVRFGLLIIARILIILTVKTSAALVGVIINSSPGDGALDASGAFLTWASAILTRIYHEPVKMTGAALGLWSHSNATGRELRAYLGPLRSDEATEVNDLDRFSEYSGPWSRVRVNSDHRWSAPALDDDMDVESIDFALKYRNLSLRKRFFGGRKVRLLIMLHALVCITVEITTLVVALKQLIGYLTQDNAVKFVSEDEGGQCGLAREPAFFGIIFLQIINLLAMQHSLIPLLGFAASHRKADEGTRASAVRGIAVVIVLLTWVISLAVLPLLTSRLDPMFLTGDLPLFSYMMIAPPSYSSLTYGISLAFAIGSLLVGCLAVYKLQEFLSAKRRAS